MLHYLMTNDSIYQVEPGRILVYVNILSLYLHLPLGSVISGTTARHMLILYFNSLRYNSMHKTESLWIKPVAR